MPCSASTWAYTRNIFSSVDDIRDGIRISCACLCRLRTRASVAIMSTWHFCVVRNLSEKIPYSFFLCLTSGAIFCPFQIQSALKIQHSYVGTLSVQCAIYRQQFPALSGSFVTTRSITGSPRKNACLAVIEFAGSSYFIIECTITSTQLSRIIIQHLNLLSQVLRRTTVSPLDFIVLRKNIVGWSSYSGFKGQSIHSATFPEHFSGKGSWTFHLKYQNTAQKRSLRCAGMAFCFVYDF